MAGLKFDDSMPRVLSSKTHSMIDYMHVATNLVAGALFWKLNKRAAAGAFILGGSVLANSLMTDYELGVFRLYSFQVHGILDYAFAASSAAMPAIMGFANKTSVEILLRPRRWRVSHCRDLGLRRQFRRNPYRYATRRPGTSE